MERQQAERHERMQRQQEQEQQEEETEAPSAPAASGAYVPPSVRRAKAAAAAAALSDSSSAEDAELKQRCTGLLNRYIRIPPLRVKSLSNLCCSPLSKSGHRLSDDNRDALLEKTLSLFRAHRSILLEDLCC